ncbi:unnamed protein product, partial [marine sediment metagenome]
ISIILGLVLLPVMATFSYNATHNLPADGNWSNVTDNTDVTGVAGLSSLLTLILYGFTFGLVGLGIGLIYIGFKGKK